MPHPLGKRRRLNAGRFHHIAKNSLDRPVLIVHNSSTRFVYDGVNPRSPPQLKYFWGSSRAGIPKNGKQKNKTCSATGGQMTQRSRIFLSLLLAVLFAAVRLAHGQASTAGELTGTVADPSGAVIA